jgi:hypothetical protein
MSNPEYNGTPAPSGEFDPTTRHIQEITATMGVQPALPGNEQRSAAPPPSLPLGRLASLHRQGIHTLISRGPRSDREALEATIRRQREAAADFPSMPEGLDIDGAQEFFAERGLIMKPVTVLTEDTVEAFREEMRRVGASNMSIEELGWQNPRTGGRIIAHYSVPLDRIIAIRPNRPLTPLEQYELNKAIAHDGAHSTIQADKLVYVREGDGLSLNLDAASGFLHNTRGGPGSAAEEAYAELEGADYVRKKLGMPNGIWGGDTPGTAQLGDFPSVPLVYLSPTDEAMQNATMVPGALTAYALEQIAEVRPELRAALDASRTSVEGRRQVAKIINSVQPGLYARFLHARENNPHDFAALLLDVEAALGKR